MPHAIDKKWPHVNSLRNKKNVIVEPTKAVMVLVSIFCMEQPPIVSRWSQRCSLSLEKKDAVCEPSTAGTPRRWYVDELAIPITYTAGMMMSVLLLLLFLLHFLVRTPLTLLKKYFYYFNIIIIIIIGDGLKTQSLLVTRDSCCK